MNYSFRKVNAPAGSRQPHRQHARMGLLALLTALSLLMAPLAPLVPTPNAAPLGATVSTWAESFRMPSVAAWHGEIGALYNHLFAAQPAAAQTVTVTVDEQFSSDGTTFGDDVSVEQYRTVTERIYYNNTDSTAATGVTISATIPSGFTLVPNSTRNCLNPTPGETVCNTSSGQGGPINEAAVWNGRTLNIAPTAGLFGAPVSATSGRLEVGRKRYINIHECQYFQASINDDFTTIAVPGGPFATGTNASNMANSSPVCGSGGSGGHNLQSTHVRAFDTLGRRYFNFHECQYLEQPGTLDNIFVSAIQGLSGTNASNTPDSVASCGTNWGNHPYWSSSVRVLDTRDKRYFNISECQYYNSGTGEDFFTNLWSAPNTGYSTTAMTAAGCSNAAGFTLQGFNFLALDTYDTSRGTGFIEFKMRANAAPNVYQQTANMDGNEFTPQTDSGTITVLPPPPVVVDKKFSTNGVTFVDDIAVLQGTTLTERLYYNNTDSVVGTGSTINTTVPAGFTLVLGSTKVCLEPTPGEVVCNTSPGMGGPIDESVVWFGQTLNIAPTAGLYGQPVNATSGRLEVGRKRYVNLHECQYFNGATAEDFFTNVERTGTNVNNSADTRPSCIAGDWGGHDLWRQWVRSLDLLGRRYLNLHECQYFNRSDTDDFFAIVPNAGTKTSNSADVGPNCNNINWGGHTLWRQWVQNLDSLGNRYLNLHECQYYNQSNGDDFFTSGTSTGVNFSNSADASPLCSPGPWGGHILWSQWVRPLDLLDTARGVGFIEFKVVANATVGTYSQDVTGSGNEFADYTDSGTIDVRTLVDDDGDGIPNWVEGDGFVDTDNDGKPDSQDADSDNDGIPDAVERGTNPNSPRDTDGDGINDYRDLDSDDDGINDVVEAGGLTDADNDGMADGTDGNGDGMIDSPQNTPVDTDSDGVADYRDLDSDNDTISDLLEGGSNATDADNDGVADGPDTDGDGIVDNADDLSGFGDAVGPALPDKDSGSDDDGAPDYLDVDDDSSGGALDIDAAGNGNLDTNDDGILDGSDTGGSTDADGDGVDDLIDDDPGVFGGLNNDTDGDSIPNTLDADDDNDGIPDTVEMANAPVNGDTDGDGIPDALDLDADNDGINDVVEAGGADADGDGQIDNPTTNQGTLTNPTNSDGDGQPNYVDLDSDNDTVSDLVEGDSIGSDTDDDGMVDGPDTDGDGIQDSVDGLSGFGDADVGGLPDKDSTSDDDAAPDYADPDDDANGGAQDIDHTANAALDTNNDGALDGTDAGSQGDPDGDGVDNAIDTDDGNFGGLPAPVNAAPTITQPATDPAAITISENTTVITDVNTTDDIDSEGSGLTYGLSGVDAGWMSIDGSGNLRFLGAPDYEFPADNGGDNVYTVTVTVTDTGYLTDSVDIQVTVTDSPADDPGAGIEYKVRYNGTTGRYEVYMRPTAQPLSLNQTGTAQVTLKAPHVAGAGAFTVTNLIPYTDTAWTVDSQVDAPSEAPGYDYLSLQVDFPTNNSATFGWQNGVERLVFSFVNGGACAGPVTIMENNDPFNLLPNSAGTNPGQQIDVFGLGSDPGNDFLGVYDLGQAECGIPVLLPVKAFLQGAYDAGSDLLRDDLRTLPDFPLTSPYGDGATLGDANLLTLTGNDAIVDWVLVEVRDPAITTTVVISRAALLQRDGDVVALDGSSPLSVTLAGGNYHLALRHRNHLGVMTGSPVALSAATALIDFTTMNDAASYGAHSQVYHSSGVYLLWMGDVNGDNQVIVAGPNNDRNPILAAVLGDAGNTNHNYNYIVTGYLAADLDLDGRTIAAGPGNDINPLFYSVFTHPANTNIAANFIINGQAP